MKHIKPSQNLVRDFKRHADFFNEFLEDKKDH